MLVWIVGRVWEPAALDYAFNALRYSRRLGKLGYVRFRYWKLYAELGLERQPVAVWLYKAQLTIEFQDTQLARYTVEYQPDQKHFRDVSEPTVYETQYRSPQLPLWQFCDDAWLKIVRLPRLTVRTKRPSHRSCNDGCLGNDIGIGHGEGFSLALGEPNSAIARTVGHMFRQSTSFPTALVPRFPGLRFEQAQICAQTVMIRLRTEQPSAPCPQCASRSTAIHSRYTRMPADLPWGGYAVRFMLHVRKFFCRTPTCGQRIFTERLPGVVQPLARKTVRLHDILQVIAFALGGEAGARLTDRLGMATSPATLIRMMRQSAPTTYATPRVLGVDDWAKRKGAKYGPILVDLEAHRVVDLLPDRTAETFQAWLEARPGVEIISRDRGERYATGGKAGAPDALHIADRWHLIRNWAEVIERVMRRHQTLLRKVKRVKPLPSGATAATLLPPKSVNRRRLYADARREQAQRERFERWTTIRDRYAKGASLKDIERELRLNYKTVRKYAHAAECSHMKAYPPRRRLLTPYEPYLRGRWTEGCRNGKQLFREIQAHGFRGSRVLVSMFVAQLRRDEGLSLPWLPKLAREEPVTPRDVVNLFLVRASHRSAEDVTALDEVRNLHAEFEHVFQLSERFTQMVRDQLGGAFDDWMTDAHASLVREVRQFARNLQNDEAAIRAALDYPWSQGQVEGQVHRLKLVKRSMYGRANFDLLRLRVMHAA